MSDVRRHIERGRLALRVREEFRERVRGIAVLPHDDGGDPLAHIRERVAKLEERAIRMTVGVDESRSEHQPFAGHDRLARPLMEIANVGDSVADHAHARHAARRSRAIDHARVDDEHSLRSRLDGRGRSRLRAGGRERKRSE